MAVLLWKGGDRMSKKLVFMIAACFCVLAFAGSASGAAFQITYDGYLQKVAAQGGVSADTLIVVNNPNPSNAMPVTIQVFDKHGVLEADTTFLYDGGSQVSTAPPNGYVWITLGMIVGRDTHDPWLFPGAEKFLFKVTTGGRQVPTVEIKQVIYNAPQEYPGEGIWQAGNIKTWAETCLGGKKSPGITKVPKKVPW